MGRVRLDPSIISRAVGENVPLNDLASVYQNAQMFHARQQEYGVNEEKIRQQQVMNEAYKAATNPDGSVDNGRLQSYLAQNTTGAAIPGIQKANMELRKTAGEVKNKDADTDKTLQANLYEGLKLVDNTLASLISRPDVDERMVYGEMARMVNAGAFNIQAKQQGTTPDEYMKSLLSTMPVGNPEQLKSWLVQQGARVADATKRYEMSLPKYDEQDQGGVINQGTINQMTGQRTAGTNVTKTATPGEVLSSNDQRRGQNMTENRALRQEAADAKNNVAAGPEQQEAIAKMIANGQMAPLSGPALRTAEGLAIMARVAALNPEFQGQNYGAIDKATKDFTTGRAGNTVRSFNVALSHLDTLDKLSDALKNNDTQMVNKVSQYFSQQSGAPAVTNFDTAKKVVADEVVKAIVGSGGGVHDREEAARVILSSNSPAQLKQSINTYRTLMYGQLDGLEQQYSSTTGKKDFERFLSPEAQASRPHRTAPASAGGAPPSGAAPGAGGRPPLDSFFRKP